MPNTPYYRRSVFLAVITGIVVVCVWLLGVIYQRSKEMPNPYAQVPVESVYSLICIYEDGMPGEHASRSETLNVSEEIKEVFKEVTRKPVRHVDMFFDVVSSPYLFVDKNGEVLVAVVYRPNQQVVQFVEAERGKDGYKCRGSKFDDCVVWLPEFPAILRKAKHAGLEGVK